MSFKNRLGVLALAFLLTLFWAVPQIKARWTISPPRPAVSAVSAPSPAAPAVRVKRKVHKKKPVDIPDKTLDETASRKKVRGERLREKGEALGGGTAEKE